MNSTSSCKTYREKTYRQGTDRLSPASNCAVPSTRHARAVSLAGTRRCNWPPASKRPYGSSKRTEGCWHHVPQPNAGTSMGYSQHTIGPTAAVIAIDPRDHGGMKSYSEDLRRKIVDAVEQRGTSKTRAARLFDVSLSSVKRYSRMARQGNSLAPQKRPGRTPKADEKVKKLLNEHMKERPTATIAERIRFLQSITGECLSYSTIRRFIETSRMEPKKGVWVQPNETSGPEPPGG